VQDHQLSPQCRFVQQRRERLDGDRMLSPLGLVDNQRRWRMRLQQRRREANEPQRAVGKVPGLKRKPAALLLPLQPHQSLRALLLGYEQEIVEKRRDQPYAVNNARIVIGKVRLTHVQQERGEGLDHRSGRRVDKR